MIPQSSNLSTTRSFIHSGVSETSRLTPAATMECGSASWHLVHMYLYPKKNLVLLTEGTWPTVAPIYT